MATSTRAAIRTLMLTEYGIGRQGTNSGASASAITDAINFTGPRGDEGVDIGSAVYITSHSASAAPYGESTRVNGRPVQTTGVMQLQPSLTAALAATDTFDLAAVPIVFDSGDGRHSIHRAISEALAKLRFEKRITPITQVVDGDMRLSGTSNWTASVSTLSKVAGSFPYGLDELSVANAGYGRTASMAVDEDDTYYLEATGRVTGGSGTLVLYDVTNAAAITLTNDTITLLEPETLVNTSVAIPAGCKQVQIRLTTVGAFTSYWSNVILRPNKARNFAVADRPVRVLDIGNLMYYTSDEFFGRGEPVMVEMAKPEQLAGGVWNLRTGANVSGLSLWYEEFTHAADLTSDTSTTTIPAEHVAAVAAEILLRPLALQNPKWAAWWKKALDSSGAALAEYHQHLRTYVTSGPKLYYLAKV